MRHTGAQKRSSPRTGRPDDRPDTHRRRNPNTPTSSDGRFGAVYAFDLQRRIGRSADQSGHSGQFMSDHGARLARSMTQRKTAPVSGSGSSIAQDSGLSL